ncbi:hypothetical protein C5167_024994 [Papaver somniferum]|uniref:Uncharacterized protein n=1 Tax=Papaver somniferum TaxID=3469 RepID=A0A4Y7JTV6_PAPSO|nr:hypothetical protein C5167_024994 [Papaver somniferum]
MSPKEQGVQIISAYDQGFKSTNGLDA